MALRAVIDHPKFSRLKSLLKTNRACTLGYLEAMWHFCGRFTQQGNIGKYPIEEIESWIEWPGESGALIDALIKSKWIDEDPVHGLLVHDWHKHADAATKLALKRSGLEFIVPTVSQQCSDSVATVLGLPVPVPVSENGIEGNRTEPEEPKEKAPRKETKPKTREAFDDYCKEIGLPPSESQKAWLYWHQEHEWKNVKCWKARLQTWKINWEKRDGRKDPDLRTEGTRFVFGEGA